MEFFPTGNDLLKVASLISTRQHQSEKSEVLLSGDMRATNYPYYDIGAADHSPDHRFFAVTEDWQGSERYTLTIFQAGTQEQLEDSLSDCRGDFEWSTDSTKISGTRLDENQRPSSVWCHDIGSIQNDDQLVFDLENPGRFIGLGKTSSEKWITIDIHDHQTNQSFLLSATLADLTPLPVTDWIEGLEYEVEEFNSYLIIRGNHDHEDFALIGRQRRIFQGPVTQIHGRLLWVPTEGSVFSDYEVLKNHWIIEYSEEGVWSISNC